jgi:hypothetical protein
MYFLKVGGEKKAASPKPKDTYQTTMPFQKNDFFWNDTASICLSVFVRSWFKPSSYQTAKAWLIQKITCANPTWQSALCSALHLWI